LAKCHELNVIRVCFRFVFLVPFLILSADGARPAHSHINENILIVDFLATTGGFGCALSSVITILIFFPRDFQAEVDRDYEKIQKNNKKSSTQNRGSYLITGSPVSAAQPLPDLEYGNAIDVTPSPVALQPLAEYEEEADEHSYEGSLKVGWIEPAQQLPPEQDFKDFTDYVNSKALPSTSFHPSRRSSRQQRFGGASGGGVSGPPGSQVAVVGGTGPSVYSPTNHSNSKPSPTTMNPWSKPPSVDVRASRDLSFPLTMHNLALHTTLERSRTGIVNTSSRPSRPSIYSFKSPIDMLL